MLRIGVILMACALGCVAQTSSRSVMAKRFPPEIWSGKGDSASMRKNSYCVDRSFESKSIAFRRCEPKTTIRLVRTTAVVPKPSAK